MLQLAFHFDQSRCVACNTCTVACKDWKSVNPGPASWMNLTVTESGTIAGANLTIYNLAMPCNHCEVPICVEVCPVEAITKRTEDGIVLVDRKNCIATKLCLINCPFGAPQYGDDKSEPDMDPSWLVAHPMQKCDFCIDRWEIGKKPVCVDACLTRALDAGPKTVLEARYPDAPLTVVGFPDPAKNPAGGGITATDPAILFKAKTDTVYP